jgi:hypothetical protein
LANERKFLCWVALRVPDREAKTPEFSSSSFPFQSRDSHFTGVKPPQTFPAVSTRSVRAFAAEPVVSAPPQQRPLLRAGLFEQRRKFGNDQRLEPDRAALKLRL